MGELYGVSFVSIVKKHYDIKGVSLYFLTFQQVCQGQWGCDDAEEVESWSSLFPSLSHRLPVTLYTGL